MHSRWTLPAFSLVLGLVLLAALAAGHQLVTGIWSCGIMVLFGAAVLARRPERDHPRAAR